MYSYILGMIESNYGEAGGDLNSKMVLVVADINS